MTTTPLTDQQLRAVIVSAITGDALRPRTERVGVVDAMLAVVWPELDRLAAELGRVRAELATTQAELRREVRQHGQTINERDHATDMADKLAAAIASEDVIGEHSGGNCPWTNALNYASEQAHLAEQRAAAAVPSA